MKCKNKWCAREIRHPGRCSDVGPYAINSQSAINTIAINSPSPEMMDLARKAVIAQKADKRTPEQFATEMAPALAGPGDEGTRSANRRDRKAYNDYMREYMRKKRKKPLGVPYG